MISVIFKIINFFFIFSNSFFNLERTGVVVFFLSICASNVNVFFEAMSDCRGNGSSYENTAN